MGAVIGEWLGAKEGLGNYLTLSQRSFMVDRVFCRNFGDHCFELTDLCCDCYLRKADHSLE